MHEIKGKNFLPFVSKQSEEICMNVNCYTEKVDDLRKSSQQFRELENLKSLILTDEKIPLIHNLHDVYVVMFFFCCFQISGQHFARKIPNLSLSMYVC